MPKLRRKDGEGDGAFNERYSEIQDKGIKSLRNAKRCFKILDEYSKHQYGKNANFNESIVQTIQECIEAFED